MSARLLEPKAFGYLLAMFASLTNRSNNLRYGSRGRCRKWRMKSFNCTAAQNGRPRRCLSIPITKVPGECLRSGITASMNFPFFGNRPRTPPVGIGCTAPGEIVLKDEHPLGGEFFRDKPADPDNAIAVSIKTVSAASIEPERVSWLWENRIPRGKLTVFCGPPDVGKSAVAIDIIARGSKGLDWPDCKNEHPPFDTLMLIAEDDLEDTTTPRLMAAGADLNRVHFVLKTVISDKAKREERQFALDTDLSILSSFLGKKPEIKLVVLDPLGSYLGKFKKNDEENIRSVLTQIKDLAAKSDVAVLSIDHFNKNFAQAAIHRLSGAGALVAVPRAVWAFVKDDRDDGVDRLMLNVKLNVAAEANKTGLKYRFSEVALTIRGKVVGLPAIAWGGRTENNLDEVLQAQTNPKEKRAAKATRFLLKCLAGGNPVPSNEIFAQGVAAGISRSALYEAKKELGVLASKVGGSWFWESVQTGEGQC